MAERRTANTGQPITVCESPVLTAGVGAHGPPGRAPRGTEWAPGGCGRQTRQIKGQTAPAPAGGCDGNTSSSCGCLNNHMGWQGTEAVTQGLAGAEPRPLTKRVAFLRDLTHGSRAGRKRAVTPFESL